MGRITERDRMIAYFSMASLEEAIRDLGTIRAMLKRRGLEQRRRHEQLTPRPEVKTAGIQEVKAK